jgi:hypothetical protein
MSVAEPMNRVTPDQQASAWQPGRSPDSLIVAWQHPVSRRVSPVGLLEHGPPGYRYRYLRRANEVDGFQGFLEFPDLTRSYTADRLFSMFAQRIMNPRRPDFGEFLRQLQLSDESTPWEQLARSEGRRRGDTVQVFPIPEVRADGSSTCRFLVHGVRHVAGVALLPVPAGDRLTLVDEPGNPVNDQAVVVSSAAGVRLGYVPDLLLEHLRAMRGEAAVEVTLEHVNGPEAPPHLRLLARLDGRVPPAYQPMSGPSWAPHWVGPAEQD